MLVRTRDILLNIEDAQNSGAAAVLLAPMTYQALTAVNLSVPLVVYDNPATTHVHFTDDLHGRISQLDAVASIKIPAVSTDPAEARSRVDRLRALIPATVTIGVSGDAAGANGLIAGCSGWYSVIAGILPEQCLAIARAAIAGNADEARALSAKMDSLWALFAQYGSYRVTSAVAEDLGLVSSPNLPRPVRSLDEEGRRGVAAALEVMGVRA